MAGLIETNAPLPGPKPMHPEERLWFIERAIDVFGAQEGGAGKLHIRIEIYETRRGY